MDREGVGWKSEGQGCLEKVQDGTEGTYKLRGVFQERWRPRPVRSREVW